MKPAGIEPHGMIADRRWLQAHPPPQAGRERHRHLVDIDDEGAILPAHLARPNREANRAAGDGCLPALRHAPAVPALAVKGDVERTVILWVGRSLAPGSGVIGREHAPHETDDGQPMAAIVTQAIEVPPAIATRRNLGIEALRAMRLSAARRPESAAIGTPGPGCALPPARNSPSISVLALGL